MTEIRFHPAAEAELTEAADWYEARRQGLGEAFERAVDETVSLMSKVPSGGTPWSGTEVRRWRVRQFPYQLVYFADPTGLVVVAVAHDKREPGYWTERHNAAEPR